MIFTCDFLHDFILLHHLECMNFPPSSPPAPGMYNFPLGTSPYQLVNPRILSINNLTHETKRPVATGKVGSSLNTAATVEALMLGIVLGTVPWMTWMSCFRMAGWSLLGGQFLDKITWLYKF